MMSDTRPRLPFASGLPLQENERAARTLQDALADSEKAMGKRRYKKRWRMYLGKTSPEAIASVRRMLGERDE